jgi:hypothetical protein
MKSLLVGLAILASVASGQTRPKNSYRRPGGAPTAPARPVSPEVHPDHTITVRLPAPQVSTVALLFGGSKPMTKDDAGLWSITIGPVEPEIYTYNFVVDGVRILDAGTNNIKNGHFLDSGVVEVPGSPARLDEFRNVPHGALGMRTYTSSPLQILRQVYVYPPPQYAAEPNRKFPVLYLRHGSGDSEQNWSDTGRAGVILDNLIAEHKAQPMTIVMPNCDVATTSPVEVLRAASK